jgi:hypothetical protein
MKRLLIAICLLAASGVLAQTSGTIVNPSQGHVTLECNPAWNNCGTITLTDRTTQKIIPSPVWVADPSAGHYDCPDGWTAYGKSEPEVFKAGGYAVPASAIYRTPNLDKKGHVLGEQPVPPICLQEKP